MTKDTYGPKSIVPYASYDRSTHSWRMFKATEALDSEKYSQTWPRKGWIRNGLVYELTTWERHMRGGEFSSLLPTPTSTDYKRDNYKAVHSRNTPPVTALDTYFFEGNVREEFQAVVLRWERLTRKAPPIEGMSRRGNRILSAEYVEWLMGLPAGWVTSPKIGLARYLKIKVLGNGVVPQQAEEALRLLLDMNEIDPGKRKNEA